MHLVLLGLSGSGKTTVGRLLSKELGVPLLSSGDVARELARNDPTTRLALEKGALAPEQTMRARIQQLVEAADAEHGGWVLDGFPRSVEQLVCLMQWTAALPDFAYLDVPLWTCLERLVGRKREHDTPEAIARRFAQWDQDTHQVVSLLDEGGVLQTFQNYSTENIVSEFLETYRS